MAEPGGGKAIVKVPVDSSEFDAFLQKFHDYQTLLEDQPEQWRDSAKGIKEADRAFGKMEASFSKLVKASVDPKFSSPTNGVFKRVEKSSKEIERSWTSIGRDVEKASKGLGNLARNGLNFASLGAFGGIGSLVGALGVGAYAATSDLAQQNAQNRSLGLGPGQASAFGIEYGRAGGDDALLAKIAQAKTDPTMWRGLIAGGLTQSEIRAQDPVQLAAELLQRGGEKYKSYGVNGGLYAQSTGLTDYLSPLQLNQASSYGPADFQKMADSYATELPKLAASQAKYDEATQKMAEMQGDFAQIELNIELALFKLEPEFRKLADEAAAWATAFANSGELDSDIKSIEGAISGFAHFLEGVEKKLNDLFGLTGKKQNPDEGVWYHADAGSVGANVVQAVKNVWDVAHGGTSRGGASSAVDWGLTGAGGGSGNDAMLNAIMMVESGGQNGKTNLTTGAAGLYQITPENYKRDNVDPMDPDQARAEALKIYESFLTRYHGDEAKALAGYNGFGAEDRDIAKYGDAWRDHIGEFQQSGETAAYLKRIEAQGISLGTADSRATKANAQGDDFPIVAYDGANPDADASSPAYRSINGLSDIAKNLGKLASNTFSAGAGAGFRTPDSMLAARIARQGNQPQTPYQIQVSVSAPAGSNTSVTAGSFPQ